MGIYHTYFCSDRDIQMRSYRAIRTPTECSRFDLDVDGCEAGVWPLCHMHLHAPSYYNYPNEHIHKDGDDDGVLGLFPLILVCVFFCWVLEF